MKKLILSAISIVVLCGICSAQADTTTFTKVGDKAPKFSCTTIDGQAFDLSKMKGKIVMINFFATWCGPCNAELPVLQKTIWEKYKNNNSFRLIILGREHTAQEVTDFVKSKNFTMPFAPDPERKVFSLYASQSIPRNVIVGKDGRIIFQSIGYTEEEFKKVVEVLAKELK